MNSTDVIDNNGYFVDHLKEQKNDIGGIYIYHIGPSVIFYTIVTGLRCQLVLYSDLEHYNNIRIFSNYIAARSEKIA